MATRKPSGRTVSAMVTMTEYGEINIMAGNKGLTVSELIKQRLLNPNLEINLMQKFWHAIDIPIRDKSITTEKRMKQVIEIMDDCLGKNSIDLNSFLDDYIYKNIGRVSSEDKAQYGMYIKK